MTMLSQPNYLIRQIIVRNVLTYLRETSHIACHILFQVTDKLQALNDEFAAMTKQKKELEDSIELCSQKLDRAEKLITGLGGEKARWSDIARELLQTLANVVGDVLLSAGIIAYLGPFNMIFRQVSDSNENLYLNRRSQFGN